MRNKYLNKKKITKVINPPTQSFRRLLEPDSLYDLLKKLKKKNIEPCDCVRCLNFVAFNFKFFVSFVKARTNGTENQFEKDKKKGKK